MHLTFVAVYVNVISVNYVYFFHNSEKVIVE